MSQTLYRKYRPQSFDELTGQDHIKKTLQQQVTSGRVAHAYLFTGPRGVGKTTTARLLAAAINAADETDAEPILKGRDLDVVEIDAASHSGVDTVREEIVESARFTPQKRTYKVFIIDEVHMLSTSAFNALLKVLEEPPRHAIFILATTELHKVPATVVSRCQRFDFKALSLDTIVKKLSDIAKKEKVSVDEDVLSYIARLAEGSMRDAESLLGQVLALGEKTISMDRAGLILPTTNVTLAVDAIAAIMHGDRAEAISLINRSVEQGIDLARLTADAIEVLRNMLLLRTVGSLESFATPFTDDVIKSIHELTGQASQTQIVKMIDTLARRRLEMKTAVLEQLPLEMAVVELCGAAGDSVSQQEAADAKQAPTAQKKTRPKSPEPEQQTQKKTEIVDSKHHISDLTVDISAIKGRWTGFLTELQKENPSLVLILKTAEPLSINGATLEIGYKYPFHKDRMDSEECRGIVENVFNMFYNQHARIKNSVLPHDYASEFIAEVTRDDEIEFVADDAPSKEQTTPITAKESRGEPVQQDDLIANLVEAFGGRVVE